MTKILVIPPTIGRRVLVFAAGTAGGVPQINNSAVPFDGGIAYVHSTGGHVPGDPLAQASIINVGYVDHNGEAQSKTSVKLYDRAQGTTDAHGKEWYAVWMPYQFEQAQRAMQPKVTGQANQAGRPADVNLDERKLEDNGVAVDPPASLPRPEGLGENATGEQLREQYDSARARAGTEAA